MCAAAARRRNAENSRRKKEIPAGWTRLDAVLAALILALTLAAYSRVAWCQFLAIDDPQYVTANPHVQAGLSWAGAQWALATFHDGNWFPLTWLSHMAVVSAFGLDSGFHHLANLAPHAIGALLLFAALRLMTGSRWPSAFAALLFAIHPVHVESVAWVAERKDVLSGLFWMASFVGYAFYARRPGWRRYMLVLAPFALGLLSKSMIVTLPFVLLLLDVWPLGRASGPPLRAHLAEAEGEGGRAWRSLVLEKVPLLALAAADSIVTFVAQQSAGAVAPLERAPFGLRVANALWSYVAYVGSFCWPRGLAVFYPYDPAIPWWQTVIAVAALAGVSAIALRRLAASPYLAVGWCWFLGTLVPVIGLVQVGSQARADRYTYVPSVGLSIMLAWGAAEIAAKRPRTRLPLVVLAGAVSTSCAILTWSQVQVWHDSTALFEHALKVTRNNFVALDGVGLQLRLAGRIDEALPYFREAIRISPGFAGGQNNLGEALVARGRAEEAMPHLVEAVRINPNLREARVSLATAQGQLGRADEAIATYEEVVARWPEYAVARSRLGLALAERGRAGDGLAQLREAVRLTPENADAHYDLGRVLLGTGDADAAAAEFTETLRLHPEFAEGHFNLGNVMASRGQFDAAMARYRKAIRLKPEFARAHANLGTALATTGRIDEAIAEFTEALRLDPTLTDVRANLDYARAAKK